MYAVMTTILATTLKAMRYLATVALLVILTVASGYEFYFYKTRIILTTHWILNRFFMSQSKNNWLKKISKNIHSGLLVPSNSRKISASKRRPREIWNCANQWALGHHNALWKTLRHFLLPLNVPGNVSISWIARSSRCLCQPTVHGRGIEVW